MNQRIKEFAQQAGVVALSEKGIAPPLEKFAELIVSECADWVKSRTMSNELKTELKRHFGVK